MADRTIIDVLLAELERDPAQHAVRIHVAGLLLDAGEAAEAFDLVVAGLALTPADVDLLTLGVRAGRASGNDPQADAYATLLAALGGASTPNDTAPPAPGSAPPEPPTTEPPPEPMKVTDFGPAPDTADDLIAAWDDSDAPAEPDVGFLEISRTMLSDVGGMHDVKERLELSFLGPMRNPELQAAFGKSMRGGLMLWGPPGCGKTFMAKAVAGELGAKFYTVGLADVLNMYIGNSERNIRSIFEVARANRPCVLFLDEIDALGMKRSELSGRGAMRGVVNQLLTELDGVDSDNDGVFVLAATNHPWDVDAALLRPGRLDRALLVLPPDLAARAAILEYHLRGRPNEGIDVSRIASATDGLTGADLALIVEQATEEALAASIKKGGVQPITTKSLLKAAKGTRTTIGGWMETARNHATFGNTDGMYDELAAYLRRKK